jgi:cysteine desulfurase/selenocysteine lyase
MRDYRKEFFDFAPFVYLDCAYQGPFPRRTAARIQQAIELKCYPHSLRAPEYVDLPERVRARLARIIGARPDEIALTNSATQGVGIVATGLGLGSGDEVIVAATNFPANLFTWLHLQRLGVKVHVLKPQSGVVGPDDLRAVISQRTRVVALDWVTYDTGLRADLAALGEIAHRHGAIFVVDGTQGVGAVPLDVRDLPVDVMAVAAYKWLLGPYGTGFAYLSQQIQDRLDLSVLNWLTVEGSANFDTLPVEEFTLERGAKIFDVPETSNFLNLYGLEASLEFVEQVTVAAVWQHCRVLLGRLQDGLRTQALMVLGDTRPEESSTILSFRAESADATARLYVTLKTRLIAVSLRRGSIRVSPYLYNTEADIEALLEAIEE